MRGPLTVAAVGDVIPAASLGSVADLLGGADLAVGNLDTALTVRGYPREKLINVRADGSVVAPELARVGFDVLSVANNHSTDFGAVGLFDTLDALAGAGVRAVGGGADLAAAVAPAIVDAAGWRVGVSAWTAVLPTGAAAGASRPGLAPLHVRTAYEVDPYLLMEEPATVPTVRSSVAPEDLARACSAVGALREETDFVVVLVHWGGGLSEGLAEYQRPLAHALLDAGADLIVGSHPHRVLGVERYGGKAILYSGGTLIDQLDRSTVADELQGIFELVSPDSLVATVRVSPEGGYELRLTPTTMGEGGVAVVASGEAFERIASRVARLSADLDTPVEVGDGTLVVPVSAPVTPV